jgi:hypothetical protein
MMRKRQAGCAQWLCKAGTSNRSIRWGFIPSKGAHLAMYITGWIFFTGARTTSYYFQSYRADGWEHLGKMGAWQYFRKQIGNGEMPENCPGSRTKFKKYQHDLSILVVILPLYFNAILLLNKQAGVIAEISTVALFLFLLVYIYSITRLLTRIKQLRKKS